jgi:hypothetical protein
MKKLVIALLSLAVVMLSTAWGSTMKNSSSSSNQKAAVKTQYSSDSMQAATPEKV